MPHFVILRFSAMGDVVLLTPVVNALAQQYPDAKVTVVTRPKFTTFFNHIERVETFAADVDKVYTGFSGLWRLSQEIKKLNPDFVLDLHDHLRTRMIGFFLRLSGLPVVRFYKSRKEKKQLTQKNKVNFTPLKHTVERYQEVFHQIGYPIEIKNEKHLSASSIPDQLVEDFLQKENTSDQEVWIGVAPFAMHTSKIWPIHLYQQLFGILLKEKNFRFFLFGGGAKEIAFFETLKDAFPANVSIVAGQLKLTQELQLMQQLKLMLCVDSSNMHLAALLKVPLLSIWGGTHTATGFGPYQYNEHAIIEINRETLPCRPCSVFGKESCYRGDFACLNLITPKMVADRIISALH
ncbi:MAG: glycosyltransferase family 9 protein [Cyclobacteriaceae bacterium]|jgi:ADP-heptose:LPS heptosyltransferase|nr:glycosyltransferase family 9 protein [Cyclobacteriaceae bacterium]